MILNVRVIVSETVDVSVGVSVGVDVGVSQYESVELKFHNSNLR